MVKWDDPRAIFGQRLRELRLKKDWSQEELAFQAGLDRSYISGVECGKRNIAIVNIFRLADVLGVRPEDLIRAKK